MFPLVSMYIFPIVQNIPSNDDIFTVSDISSNLDLLFMDKEEKRQNNILLPEKSTHLTNWVSIKML